MLPYTVCFIRRNDELLMLNRNKKPNMGLWNGVGGKIEVNESPFEGVVRETFEETGIELTELVYAGEVTWKSNRGDSGMYVFIADLPQEMDIITPSKVDEGILDWKKIDWILDPVNVGVVENLKFYLPKMLKGEYGVDYKFVYENGVMIDYITSEISNTNINRNSKYIQIE